MFVKYLSKNKRINKIIHFDEPIKRSALNSMEFSDENSQNAIVYSNTIDRLNHESDTGNIIKRTFVYTDEFDSEDYLKFIELELDESGVNNSNSVFWFCPIINSQEEIVRHFQPNKVVNDVIDDQTQFTTSSKLKKIYLLKA